MVERETLVVFMSMMVVVVFFGVLVRYTPIAGKTLWTVELARILLLCAAFWAAGSVESFNGHFRLAVFEQLVKGKCQLFVQLFVKLVVLITTGILIWWSIAYCQPAWKVRTFVLKWPELVFVIPLILGGLLIFTYALTAFIRNFRRLFE